MAQNNSLVKIFLFIAAVCAAWILRGDRDEREFAARIAVAPHIRDTVLTIDYIPQPPRDSTLQACSSVMTHADSARIESAFSPAWKGGKDSTRAFIEHLAAKASASVTFDSVGTVNVEYDPLTRMFTIGLELAPLKRVNTEITDKVTVPLIEHDSFATRSALVLAGAATMAIVYTIAH